MRTALLSLFSPKAPLGRTRAFAFIFLSACLFTALAATSLAETKQDFRTLWMFSTGTDLPLAVVRDGKRPYLYVAAKGGGLMILDVSSPKGAERVSSIGPDKLSDLHVMHLAQQDNYLYLALGDFFDAKGQPAGIAVVDVSDPLRPAISAIRVTESKLHGASSILVSGRFAYLSAMEFGVFIFDVNDKDTIRPVSHIVPYAEFPRKNPSRTQRPNARGMALVGNKLYLAYDSGGLRVIDVFDKYNPVETGLYVNPEMLHKQQAYNSVVIDGNHAYVAVDYCGMEIIDISDTGHMKTAGWWNPWHCDKMSSVWLNSPGHTNQIAFDAKRKRVYLSGGDSELLSIDVSDPANPVAAEAFGKLRDARAAWGLTLDGEDLYLSYISSFVPFRSTWNGIKALRPAR